MTLSEWLDISKDFLLVFSALLGVLGILNVFKSPSNKLTIWGWVAIFLMVISAIGGLIINRKDRLDSERDKQRTLLNFNEILIGLNKARHPIEDVSLSSWVELPDDNLDVERFKNNVIAEVERKKKGFASSGGGLHRPDKNLQVILSDYDGSPLIYQIGKNSNLWPTHDYSDLSDIISMYSVNFCVKLSPIMPSQFKPIHGDYKYFDWCASSIYPERINLEYKIKENKLVLYSSFKYDKSSFDDNGKLTSTDDLSGAQLFFKLPTYGSPLMLNFLKATGASLAELKRAENMKVVLSGIELDSYVISFGTSKKINIDGRDVKKYDQSEYGDFLYLTLPIDKKGYPALSRD